MSALPTDVQRATRPAVIVTLTDTDIRSAYPAARDAVQAPDPGYFETVANAATCLAIKADLVGQYRRRFRVDIAGELSVDPLETIHCWQLVASELSANLPVMLCRVEIDLEAETTAIEVLG